MKNITVFEGLVLTALVIALLSCHGCAWMKNTPGLGWAYDVAHPWTAEEWAEYEDGQGGSE